jgi:2-haloalkanoic acid dehalogenase type II
MPPTRFDVITFDCYGTLIDWERGIQGAFALEAYRSGTSFDGPSILSSYLKLEPQVESGPYRPYREILAEVASRVAEEFDWEIEPGRSDFLASSLPGWEPFEDTGPALRRLSDEGYRLGILSNIDDDLLAGSLRRLPEVFDPELIVTAQAVGSYKPAPAHFEEARGRIGNRRWLHAAQSLFHDIRPATGLGIPAAWVNRSRRSQPDDGPAPLIEVPNLAALADALIQAEIGA